MSNEILERPSDVPKGARLKLDEAGATATIDFRVPTTAVDILRLGEFYFHFDHTEKGLLTKVVYPYDPMTGDCAPVLPIENSPNVKPTPGKTPNVEILKLLGSDLFTSLEQKTNANGLHQIEIGMFADWRGETARFRKDVHKAAVRAERNFSHSRWLSANLEELANGQKPTTRFRQRLGVRIAGVCLATTACLAPAVMTLRDASQTADQALSAADQNTELRNNLRHAETVADEISDGRGPSSVEGAEVNTLTTQEAISLLEPADAHPLISNAIIAIAEQEPGTIDQLPSSSLERVSTDLSVYIPEVSEERATIEARQLKLEEEDMDQRRKFLAQLGSTAFAFSAIGMLEFRGPSKIFRRRDKNSPQGLKWK